MKSLKNWDNKTWLSSKKYIFNFNKFLLTQTKLNRNSRILDIGCGRGKILSNLSKKLKLINKPIGLDIENHKDKSKNIIFRKLDASTFISKSKIKFDLILIKQTIHLFNLNEVKRLLNLSRKNLNQNGKILILSLDTYNNELPTFKLMRKKLTKSLKKDKRILKLITKLYLHKKSKFIFKVNIDKNKYLKMIKARYISTLLSMSDSELQKGLNEIEYKYKNNIKFRDKLICLAL